MLTEHLKRFQRWADEFFRTSNGAAVVFLLALLTGGSLVGSRLVSDGTLGRFVLEFGAALGFGCTLQAAIHGARPLLGRLMVMLGGFLLVWAGAAIVYAERPADSIPAMEPVTMVLFAAFSAGLVLAIAVPVAALGAWIEGEDEPLALDADDLDGGERPW
jgi:hypothetical protein